MSDNIEWMECVENRGKIVTRLSKLEKRIVKLEIILKKVLEDGK